MSRPVMNGVTDKNYPISNFLRKKLDLMITKIAKHKQDALILIDGDEGSGKSNLQIVVGYYMAYQLGRKFDINNVYFDLEALMNDAINSEKGVFCWDEGALGGLAVDWWTKNQKKLIKLLMVIRKRQHIFIICIPKFFKLNEYLVVDRATCLLHTYLANGIKHGSFTYFDKKDKEALWTYYRSKKNRNYSKFYTFIGNFSEVIGGKYNVIPELEYERKKDQAIISMGNEDKKKEEISLDGKTKERLEKREARIKEIREDILKKVLPLLKDNLKLSDDYIAKLIGINKYTIGDVRRRVLEDQRLRLEGIKQFEAEISKIPMYESNVDMKGGVAVK